MDIPAPKSDSEKEAVALKGIDAMEQFFKDIKMPVRIRDLDVEWSEDIVLKLAEKASNNGARCLGAIKKLTKEDMAEIYRKAY